MPHHTYTRSSTPQSGPSKADGNAKSDAVGSEAKVLQVNAAAGNRQTVDLLASKGNRRKVPVTKKEEPREDAAEEAAQQAGHLPRESMLRKDRASRQGASVQPRVSIRASAGKVLPKELRGPSEALAGMDLSVARLHDGPAAAKAAESMGARAFTVGRDIVFGRGQFAPNREDGRNLLAHELWHVGQNLRGAPPAVARNGNGEEEAEGDLSNTFYPYIVRAYRSALSEATQDGLLEAINTGSIDEYAGYFSGPDVLMDTLDETLAADYASVDLRPSIEELSEPTAELGELVLNLVSAGEFLVLSLGLPVSMGSREETSYGSELFIQVMSVSIARFLASEYERLLFNTEATYDIADVFDRFLEVVTRWTDPVALLELEIEGTMEGLVDLRERFDAPEATREDRQSLGPQIADLARRLLLLNNSVETLRAAAGVEESDTPLDEGLADVDIDVRDVQDTVWGEASLAYAGLTEEDVLAHLGGGPELLSAKAVSVEESAWGQGPQSTTVYPEEAFPRATDTAVEGMVKKLADRVDNLSNKVDQLHDDVVPSEPTYLLPEFIGVYDRWFAFYSPHARDMDPAFQQIDSLYQGLYSAFGYGGWEGGIGRSILMNLLGFYVGAALPGASADFSSELAAPRRRQRVGGTAEDIEYGFGEFFPGTRGPGTGAGERDSRVRYEITGEQERRNQFRELYESAESGESVAETAMGVGLIPGTENAAYGLKLNHPESSSAWLYLLSTKIEDPLGGSDGYAQEEKAMPREVVNYLLAEGQLDRTLAKRHRPRLTTPEGRTAFVGDVATTEGGLEEAEGTAAVRFDPEKATGERNPSNETVSRQQASIRLVRNKLDPTGRSSGGSMEELTGRLLGELTAYLNSYFEVNEAPGFRIAAILNIAQREWALEEQFLSAFTPERIREVLETAVLAVAGFALLARAGPLGRALSTAASEVMQRAGTAPDEATLVSIVGWLRGASGANSFIDARVWAYFARDIAKDLGELVLGMASDVALASVRALGEAGSANSRNELLQHFEPMLRDETVRTSVEESLRGDAGTMRERADAEGMSDQRVAETESDAAAVSEQFGEAPFSATADRPLALEPESGSSERVAREIESQVPESMRGRVSEAAAEAVPSTEAARSPEGPVRDVDLEEIQAEALRDLARYETEVPGGEVSREAFIQKYEDGLRFDFDARRWKRPGGRHTERVRIPEDAAPEQVLQILRARSADFTPYYEMLLREGIAESPENIVEKIQALQERGSGQYVDTVRHGIKQTYRQEVMARMTNPDPSVMRERYPDLDWSKPDAERLAAHREMLRITGDLGPADRGSLSEEWYRVMYGPAGTEHVYIKKSTMEGRGVTLERNRVADRLEGDTLRELKAVTGPLGDRDLRQFDDYMRLVGREGGSLIDVSTGGEVSQTRVRQVVYTFLDPRGAEANADWMREQLLSFGENLKFEVFNARGEREIITVNNLSKLDEHLSRGLP